jgi:hypothetical protein
VVVDDWVALSTTEVVLEGDVEPIVDNVSEEEGKGAQFPPMDVVEDGTEVVTAIVSGCCACIVCIILIASCVEIVWTPPPLPSPLFVAV